MGCAAGARGMASLMSSRCATAIGKRRAVTGATRKPSTAISSPSSAPRSTWKALIAELLMTRSSTRPPGSTLTTSGSRSVRSLARNASYFTSFKSGLAAMPPMAMPGIGAIAPPPWPMPFISAAAGAGGAAPLMDGMPPPFRSPRRSARAA